MQRPGRFLLVLLAMFVFFAGGPLVRFYTDWLWFGEVGYQFVYATVLRAQGLLFTIAFVVAVAWLMLNLRLALRSIGDIRPVFMTRDGIEVTLPGRRQMQTIASAA